MSTTSAARGRGADGRDTGLAALCAGRQGEERVVDVGLGVSLRVRQLPFSSRHLLEQKGGTLWPSGQLLAHFVRMELGPCLTPRVKVLELGCGVAALPGLTAACLGAKVTLTDLPAVVQVAQQNAAANGLHVEAAPLAWGEMEEARALAATASCVGSGTGFDMVLLADVLYDPSLHEALALTLDCVTAWHGKAFLAVQHRGAAAVPAAGDGRDGQGPLAFFRVSLPAVGWRSRQREIGESCAAVGNHSRCRSSFSIWECWREGGTPPHRGGLTAKHEAAGEGQEGAGWQEHPPLAPPEEENGEESDLPVAPPE